MSMNSQGLCPTCGRAWAEEAAVVPTGFVRRAMEPSQEARELHAEIDRAIAEAMETFRSDHAEHWEYVLRGKLDLNVQLEGDALVLRPTLRPRTCFLTG